MAYLPLLTLLASMDSPHPVAFPNYKFDVRPNTPVVPIAFDPYFPTIYDPVPRYHKPWINFFHRHNDDAITTDKDNFNITINVHHYKPEEIIVKVLGRIVIVEAKHEEKPDEDDIWRQSTRRYLLPDLADVDQVSATMSSDGILTITTPLKERTEPKERVIKIELSDKPAVRDGTKQEEQTTPSEKKTVENEIREELTTQTQESAAKPVK